MPKGVKCSVSNCHFWAEGNSCNADQISIEVDGQSANAYDTEFAEEAGMQHDAAKSAATCCETFQPKGRARHGE